MTHMPEQNEKANGRAKFAVRSLQQIEHEFLVHPADLVHPCRIYTLIKPPVERRTLFQ